MKIELFKKTEIKIQNSLNYLGEIATIIDIVFSLKDKKKQMFWSIKNKKINMNKSSNINTKSNACEKLYQFNLNTELWKKFIDKQVDFDDLMFGGHINVRQGKNGYSSLFHKLLKNLDNKDNLNLVKKYEEKRVNEDLVITYENQNYKIKKYCPHQFYSLEGAEIKDGIITCPAHGWKFCIKTRNCIKGDKKKKI